MAHIDYRPHERPRPDDAFPNVGYVRHMTGRHTSPPLIGLTGRKRSGKDTLAGFLVRDHGFVRVAFADPLKDAALAVNPIVDTDVDGHPVRLQEAVSDLGWEEAKEIREVRRTLQELGVAIRAIDDSFWVDAAMREVARLRAQGIPVVITDVRFPNEADAIQALGGRIVRVTRAGLDTSDTHVSETAMDGYDVNAWWVPNDRGIDDLAEAARVLANYVRDVA